MKKASFKCIVICLVIFALCGTACGGGSTTSEGNGKLPTSSGNGNTSIEKETESYSIQGEKYDLEDKKFVLVFKDDGKIIAELPVIDSNIIFTLDDGTLKEYETKNALTIFTGNSNDNEIIKFAKGYSFFICTLFPSLIDLITEQTTIDAIYDLNGDDEKETSIKDIVKTAVAEALLNQYSAYIPLVPGENAEWRYSDHEKNIIFFTYN